MDSRSSRKDAIGLRIGASSNGAGAAAALGDFADEQGRLLSDKSFQDATFWENFYKVRKELPFEWYAEWQDIWPLLTRHCGLSEEASSTPLPAILVPGCGNSELSAAVYDQGFVNITNVDLCREVIAEMMRKHLRLRPKMFWKVMDMTRTQFLDCSFDLVLDKGGADALFGEPDEDPSAGTRFLREVKRLIKPSGRYACITLAQRHIAERVVSTFRHGWQLEFYPMKSKDKVKPFLAVATKCAGNDAPLIAFLDNVSSAQVYALNKVIEAENRLRAVGPDGNNFKILHPGQRVPLTLGGPKAYKAVVLDAKEDLVEAKPSFGVFLVPKSKAHEWLYSSEEGQWQVVGTAERTRLIMVFVETNLLRPNIASIQDELVPLVRDLQPVSEFGDKISFLMPDDGVFKGTLIEEIDSPLTGTMLVEDVVSDKRESFRRLYFKRNPNLIQSEARLVIVKRETANGNRRGGGGGGGKKKMKGNLRRQSSIDDLKVDHSHLASAYHEGMIAGLSLIATKLESWTASKTDIRAMVIGLGAGLLPMFLYKHLPIKLIQVVELDGVVAKMAERHFGFVQDDRLQLQVGDGLVAVEALATAAAPVPNGTAIAAQQRLHILIIDADSSDPSDGLSCPPIDFLQEPFLKNAKLALAENGILIINLVSRAREPHSKAITMLSRLFDEVYSLQVDEDVNHVLFALPQSSSLKDAAAIQHAASTLMKLASRFAPWGEKGPNISMILSLLKRIK